MFVPGDYVCVDQGNGGLVDAAIRHFTHSDYCHALIYADTDGTVIEALAKHGVRRANISEYAGAKLLGSKTYLTGTERTAIVAHAESMVGKVGYGYWDIAELFLYLNGIRFNWLEDAVADDNSITICSQLVALSGRAGGITEWMCGLPYASLVTPANLANLALK